MPVRVTDIQISGIFNSSESEPFLQAVIGEVLTAQVDFEIEECFFTSNIFEVDQVILRPNVVLTQTAFNNNIIYSDDQTAFANFSLGDTIAIQGSAVDDRNYLVIELLDDNIIRVKETGGAPTTFTTAGETLAPVGITPAYVCIVTPFAGITYYYNLIENQTATNFISLIDGETQRLVCPNADATDLVTPKIMTYQGSKSYRTDTLATIIGMGVVSGIQKYRITHSTYVTPLFLADQYDDLVLRIAPDYFLANNCLRYVTSITAGRNLSDPNSVQTVEFGEQLGNTGWYNENFNGGPNEYTISNYTLERVSDSAALTALELTEEVEAVITIKNITNSPFVNGLTRTVTNFSYLPSNEDQYQNNGKTIRENFYFDRCVNTLGGASQAGDNFGSTTQIIKECETTFISSSEIEVRLVIDIATAAQAVIAGRDLKRYKIWVTTADPNLTKATSDKVALLVDVNDFFFQLTDTNLITNTHTFIQHPFTNAVDGVTVPATFPVDDIVSWSDFSIDFTGKTNDGIKINTIQHQVVLCNGINPDIILENFTSDVSTSPLFNGLVPIINVNRDRIFKIPAGEIRRVIDIQRNPALDSGNIYNWYINFPFMQRWEYWESLGTLSFLPTGIFDTNEPNNGINEDWNRYTTVAGWTIKKRVKFTIEQNGEIFSQQFDYAYTSNDFLSNAEWGNETIDSFDVGTGNPIVNGSTKLIQGYTDTKIVASFEKLSGGSPTIGEVEIVIWIETKEKGGINDIRRISSVYPTGANTWFKSTDTSNKVVKNKVGAVYTGECLIDYTKLPSDKDYPVYARLYDLTSTPPTGEKITEASVPKETEASTQKIIE